MIVGLGLEASTDSDDVKSRLGEAHAVNSRLAHAKPNFVIATENPPHAVLVGLREAHALSTEVYRDGLTGRDEHSLEAEELLEGYAVDASAGRDDETEDDIVAVDRASVGNVDQEVRSCLLQTRRNVAYDASRLLCECSGLEFCERHGRSWVWQQRVPVSSESIGVLA